MPFTLDLHSKLFADDTTLYDASDNIELLISSFIKKLDLLLEWCQFNRLDINFKKTYFMLYIFFTRKRIIIPTSIKIYNVDIEVVSSFKLLGVTIDYKFTFEKYISMTCGRINHVLHSIKKLFFLQLATKIQFFKSLYCLFSIIVCRCQSIMQNV